jgi:hypothetical protein
MVAYTCKPSYVGDVGRRIEVWRKKENKDAVDLDSRWSLAAVSSWGGHQASLSYLIIEKW